MRAMEVRFYREGSGALRLFKQGAGLYSDRRAAKKDEVVVLKARVSHSIVAVTVERDELRDESLLTRLIDEMRFAAKRRELPTGQSGVVE